MDYALKLTSGVAIGGTVHAAGDVVTVDKSLARNLLDRGKAVLATDDDAIASLIASLAVDGVDVGIVPDDGDDTDPDDTDDADPVIAGDVTDPKPKSGGAAAEQKEPA